MHCHQYEIADFLHFRSKVKGQGHKSEEICLFEPLFTTGRQLGSDRDVTIVQCTMLVALTNAKSSLPCSKELSNSWNVTLARFKGFVGQLL